MEFQKFTFSIENEKYSIDYIIIKYNIWFVFRQLEWCFSGVNLKNILKNKNLKSYVQILDEYDTVFKNKNIAENCIFINETGLYEIFNHFNIQTFDLVNKFLYKILPEKAWKDGVKLSQTITPIKDHVAFIMFSYDGVNDFIYDKYRKRYNIPFVLFKEEDEIKQLLFNIKGVFIRNGLLFIQREYINMIIAQLSSVFSPKKIISFQDWV